MVVYTFHIVLKDSQDIESIRMPPQLPKRDKLPLHLEEVLVVTKPKTMKLEFMDLTFKNTMKNYKEKTKMLSPDNSLNGKNAWPPITEPLFQTYLKPFTKKLLQ